MMVMGQIRFRSGSRGSNHQDIALLASGMEAMTPLTVLHMLSRVLLLLSACLVINTTCFVTRTHKLSRYNHSTISRHHPSLVTTLLSSSLQDDTISGRWRYHLSNNSNDVSSHNNEIIHGNYNAVITKSTDLANRWIGSFDPSQPILNDNLTNISSSPSSPPIEALQAIQATHRWADNFVRQLNLCPWAGSSLDVPGAICYWILLVDNNEEEEKLLDKMEMVVREAGEQLTLATTPNSDDGTNNDEDAAQFIDPLVAISFIVLVPMNSSNSNNIPQSNFGTFHEFFINLEDRLLDECDDYWDLMDSLDNGDDERENDDIIVDPNLSSLGCDITIAAFHPKWQFNSNEEEDDAAGNAIDYEKRTPYPTISIVMSSVIEGLMKERDSGSGQNDSSSSALATERIADLNEKTLCSIGVERLKELFDTEVLACPMSGQATITNEDESR